MATTTFATGNSNTVKAWSDRMYYDTIADDTLIGYLRSDNTLVEHNDLSRGAGDTITYPFLARLSNAGFLGQEVAAGNEQALTYYNDTIKIDELRNAVSIPAKRTIDQQRVKFNLQENTYKVLKNWYIEHMTVGAMNQLAGNTATTITYDGVSYTGAAIPKITAMNDPVAPSSTRIIRANALATDALVNADSTATLKLSYVDDCVTTARTQRPYIIPLDGKYKFKMYVHYSGFKQLLQDTTAPAQYRDIMLSKIAGGQTDAALIGETIEYNNTLIIATDKIPYGVSTTEQTNTRRAVFVGQEAGCLAFGQGFTMGKETTPGFMFNMQPYDINRLESYSVSGIAGIKKTTFNSIDHGVIVVTHYVA